MYTLCRPVSKGDANKDYQHSLPAYSVSERGGVDSGTVLAHFRRTRPSLVINLYIRTYANGIVRPRQEIASPFVNVSHTKKASFVCGLV